MPNWCSFKMTLKSNKKQNIKNLLRHIQKDGENYENYKYLVLPRLTYDRISKIYEKDNYFYVILNGECAWSCNTCMLSGTSINYNKLMKNLPHLYATGSKEHITSIEEICAIYNTEAEVISRETDIGFTEHYYINNKGKIIVSEIRKFDPSRVYSWEDPIPIPDDYERVIDIDDNVKMNEVKIKKAKEIKEFQNYDDIFIDDGELPF